MPSNLLVFGARGMLGHYVTEYMIQHGISTTPFTRSDLDLEHPMSPTTLYEFLLNKGARKETVVINCAGVIPQSSNVPISHQKYVMVNTFFPLFLGEACCKIGCKFVHITTDCVYDGLKGSPYDENCLATETNVYGLSKHAGELCWGTVIRTSIIGEELERKTSLLEWVRSHPCGAVIDGYDNHYWNGVTCLQMAKILYHIVEHDVFWQGIRHVFSPSSVTKYQLVNMIKDVYKLDLKVNKINTPSCIDKRLTSIYEPMFSVPTLHDQLHEMYMYSRVPYITIVMGYFNRKEQCLMTLSSIAKSSVADSVNVIIVDDGSDDDHDMSTHIQGFPFSVKLIKVDKKIKTWHNPVIAYNIGISHAMRMGSEWIVLQNPEVCHIGDVCKQIYEFQDTLTYYAFPVLSVCHPHGNKNIANSQFNMTSLFSQLPECSWYSHPTYRPCFYHFLTAIHRTQLTKLGGFNAAMKDGVDYDDDELLARIKRVCTPTYVQSECFGVHLWHKCFSYEGDTAYISSLRCKNKYIFEETVRNTNFVLSDPLTHMPHEEQLSIMTSYSSISPC